MKKITQTTKPLKQKDIKRNWHLIDASDKVLGRIVGKISLLLQGKNKANYVPYLDCGDYVVVVNAKKIVLTGKKSKTKVYTYYSGYPGGLKVVSYQQLLKKNPQEVIYHAVSGVLPKNRLRKKRLGRLFVFPDDKHPYSDKFKN